MAAPTVAATTEYALTTAGTTSTPTFTQTTGDLVVIFLATAQSTTTTWGDSFTNLSAASGNLHVGYKVLDGSEGGNVAITTSSTKSAAIAYNITSGTYTSPPEISTVASGTSATPDPPSITPAGGAFDYLFLAAAETAGESLDDDTFFNTAPSSPDAFTNLVQKTSGTGGAVSSNTTLGCARYASTAYSSIDPGTFGDDTSRLWHSYTVAVPPTGYTLPEADGFPYVGGGYYA